MKIFLWSLVTVLCLVPITQAAPHFVDLSSVANTALQDDAVVNNGQGGWSDEGPNDMYMYPPVEFGDVVRNGYHFHLPKPAEPLSPTVIMLRGQEKAKTKPEQIAVNVSDVKGKYVYILLNSVGAVQKESPNYQVALCKVEYADGSSVEIPLREGIEIRHWWCSQWYDNSEAAGWPIFMGRNYFSMKWRQFVAVWAMQWSNPKPEIAIRKFVFSSAGKAAPVIWAVTLDDENYRADPVALKADFKRPADVPEGYFDIKSEAERVGLYKAALTQGLIEGVRRVDVIRDDLIAVTVDGGLGKIGAGEGAKIVSSYSDPANFVLTAGKEPGSEFAPVKVARQSYESYQGDLPGYPAVTLYWHTFYLTLPSPMKQGTQYKITVKGIDETKTISKQWIADFQTTSTPVIKVNQVAYSSKATRRYAYLGWWAAGLGAVDFSGFKTFQVIDENQSDKKAIALQGEITLRKQADALSGEDVYEMDISKLGAGRYHIVVAGLGRSDSFSVGGDDIRQLYYHTMRAFYHQRCGIALTKPFTTFERPACDTECYESGFMVDNPQYKPKPNEAIRKFRGGYHDAGDNDVFTYHLRATDQYLAAVDHCENRLRDGDLNLPESGNKIPDVLDEADWALRCYMELQQPDGAIPLGRGNDEDYIRNTWKNKPRPAFGILPPRNTSSTEFAAVAAHYARLVATYDSKRAQDYTAASERALAWALSKPVDPDKIQEDHGAYLFQAWAAAELFETTGKPEYNELFLKLHKEKRTLQVNWEMAGLRPQCTWTYATSKQPSADATVQQELRKRIIESANSAAQRTDANPYRMGHDGRGLGWGNGNGGGHYGDVCLRAYWLTGEQRYLDTASLNADFLLGANPLSRTFISSIGARYPRQPQLNPALFTLSAKRGQPVPGITNYGLAESMPPGFPEKIPLWRRVRDIGSGAEVSSEFTVTETLGASSMLFASFWIMEPASLRKP